MDYFGAVEADFLREYRIDLFSLLNDRHFSFSRFVRLVMNLSQDSEFKRYVRAENEDEKKVSKVHEGHGQVNVINDAKLAEQVFSRS